MARAILLTGTDSGDRESNLSFAAARIENRAGRIISASSVHESEPWGFRSDTLFLNQALVIETQASPRELLFMVQEIEKEMGRKRVVTENLPPKEKNYESRVIDIDILYFEDMTVDTPDLKIPHPLIAQREFVLKPLAEAAADFPHPVSGKTASEMLAELKGEEAK